VVMANSASNHRFLYLKYPSTPGMPALLKMLSVRMVIFGN